MNLLNISSLVTIQFDFFSVIFLIIMIVGLFIGVFKGFVGLLVSFLSIFGSFAFTLFLTSILVDPLIDAGMFTGIQQSIFDSLATESEYLAMTITMENKDQIIPEILKLINVPEFLSHLYSGLFVNNIPSEGIVVGELISYSLTKVIASIIIFVVIFIISFIVFFILRKVAKDFNDIKVIGKINRITGAIGGLFLGFAICVCVCFVINLLMGISVGIETYFADLMGISNDDVWSISKAIMSLMQ